MRCENVIFACMGLRIQARIWCIIVGNFAENAHSSTISGVFTGGFAGPTKIQVPTQFEKLWIILNLASI